MASLYEAIERGVKQAFANPVDALGGRSVDQLLHEFRDGEIVPVVRCKDCEYWYAEIGASTGWLPCQEIATDRNWYCASGKRREQDAERNANQ